MMGYFEIVYSYKQIGSALGPTCQKALLFEKQVEVKDIDSCTQESELPVLVSIPNNSSIQQQIYCGIKEANFEPETYQEEPEVVTGVADNKGYNISLSIPKGLALDKNGTVIKKGDSVWLMTERGYSGKLEKKKFRIFSVEIDNMKPIMRARLEAVTIHPQWMVYYKDEEDRNKVKIEYSRLSTPLELGEWPTKYHLCSQEISSIEELYNGETEQANAYFNDVLLNIPIDDFVSIEASEVEKAD